MADNKNRGGGGRAGRARLGAAEFRAGNPGVRVATKGQFSTENTVNASLGGYTSPLSVGVNRFTGRRNIQTAKTAAAKAFSMASFEVGARRAAGQTGLPNQTQLRQNINKIFGL